VRDAPPAIVATMPEDLQLMVQRPYRKIDDAPDAHPPVPNDVVIRKLVDGVVTFADAQSPQREYKLTYREFRAVYDLLPRN
jgi:hypothetical protein